MTYASGTLVSVEKSKMELDRLLAKHGASQRLIGSDDVGGSACAMFAIAGRQVKLRVPLAAKTDKHFHRHRTAASQEKAWEQSCRERWRVLLLLVKAKLEAVALGITTVEREFLADVMTEDGTTVHERIRAKLAEGYETGCMPPLLGVGDG